jgi:hypothetical protein
MTEALPLPERTLRELSSEKNYGELLGHGRILSRKVRERILIPSRFYARTPEVSINIIVAFFHQKASSLTLLADEQEVIGKIHKIIFSRIQNPIDFVSAYDWLLSAFFTYAYSQEKILLYADEALVDCLAGTPYPEATPVSALQHLPYNCFALCLRQQWFYVCYDYFFQDAYTYQGVGIIIYSQSKGLYLRLPVEEDGYLMQQAQESLIAENTELMTLEDFRLLVNTLLYIATDKDTVRRVGHVLHPTPKKIIQRAASQASAESLRKEPVVLDVGIQFVAALKRYAEIEKNEASSTDSSAKRPHIRRAHPHLYWVNDLTRIGENGKPVKKAVVHYLPPTPIKGGVEREGSRKITVQRVE